MGKAFVVKGIDASGIALKRVLLLSNMRDVTDDLIIHTGKQMHEALVGFDDALMPWSGASAFVLDVSSYRGKHIVMYTSSYPEITGTYWRAFVASFTSPITASDWSSVTSTVQNAFTPSAITPYIAGEMPNDTPTMIYKDVVVPNDASYLLVSFATSLQSQLKVYVEP